MKLCDSYFEIPSGMQGELRIKEFAHTLLQSNNLELCFIESRSSKNQS
jgi:hypothetical protein